MTDILVVNAETPITLGRIGKRHYRILFVLSTATKPLTLQELKLEINSLFEKMHLSIDLASAMRELVRDGYASEEKKRRILYGNALRRRVPLPNREDPSTLYPDIQDGTS